MGVSVALRIARKFIRMAKPQAGAPRRSSLQLWLPKNGSPAARFARALRRRAHPPMACGPTERQRRKEAGADCAAVWAAEVEPRRSHGDLMTGLCEPLHI
jgi:hypothetical protein